jgi:CDP-glucose 4,6-dehydratase
MVGAMMPSAGFWAGRRVLLTGHTGFKGCWLALWLERLGAHVHGLALPPETQPSLHAITRARPSLGETIGDIRDPATCNAAMDAADPEIMIHLAAQALVRRSYREPTTTWTTNVIGTLNLLEAARHRRGTRAIVVATTDKVYRNDGAGRPFREDSPLGGHDPYSASKAAAEILVESYRLSFLGTCGAAVATARAGNVIGGGDWSEDRLVPDMLRALDAGHPVALRYPGAVRPWQHVLEPLAGYLLLAEALCQRPSATPAAFNFGPDPAAFLTVGDVVARFSACFGGRPGAAAHAGTHPAEAPYLTIDSARAAALLGWRARLDAGSAIAWTARWHAALAAGTAPRSLVIDDIERYGSLDQ